MCMKQVSFPNLSNFENHSCFYISGLFTWAWLIYLSMACLPEHGLFTWVWFVYLSMAILPEHGLFTWAWLVYLSMACVPEHGHFTWAWPFYLSMVCVPEHGLFTWAWLVLACAVASSSASSTPSWKPCEHGQAYPRFYGNNTQHI